MIVTPAPIGLLITVLQARELVRSAVSLFGPHAISLVFMAVPFVVVIEMFVVIPSRLLLAVAILGAQGFAHRASLETARFATAALTKPFATGLHSVRIR